MTAPADTSAASVLRHAAAAIRERAEAATPGPWGHGGIGVGTAYFDGRDERVICTDTVESERAQTDNPDQWLTAMRQDADNGRHIASWHPLVALAVADWLDSEADYCEQCSLACSTFAALAVATTYLGTAT